MKSSVGLLFLSIGLAFATGYLSLQLMQNDGPSIAFNNAEIANLKRRFRESHPVAGEVNTSELFSSSSGLDLIDPRSVLNSTEGKHFKQIAPIFKAAKSCRPDFIQDRDLNKAKLWIAFECGKITSLPNGFFEQPPFLFPLGQSFAALAMKTGRPEFQNEEWIKSNIPFFHALELKDLSSKIEDPRRRLLSTLTSNELLAMVSGQGWILGPSSILVKRSNDSIQTYSIQSQPAVDYLAYDRTEWDHFLSQYRVETRSDKMVGCLYQEDSLCWTRSTQIPTKKIRWSVIALFCLATALILFCVAQIIRSIRAQKREDDRKKFALQSLTHELRTPLASLVVSSEQMMKQFSELPSSVQENFLRIFDDVQRLTRVAETSRHYLGATESKGIISFNVSEIPSINNFIDSVLDRYAGEIALNSLKSDEAFALDPYWTGVCLQNLVQNALQHGRKPVTVEVKRESNKLILVVCDCGSLPGSVKEQKNIFEPFYKETGSSGLGLGLSIVKTVIEAMGSELKVSSNPTRFELLIEGR